MRFDSYETLSAWDFIWPDHGDGPWLLVFDGIEEALGANRSAIGVYWIGYSSGTNQSSFVPKYCGKSVKQPLYRRLRQHARRSSNALIRAHLASEDMPRLYFRYVELPSLQLAELLEGLEIAAFSEDYWNKRNEWIQHWAMDEDYPRK
ncbi:MAG TPA: hypothetical protein VGK29_12725 [Paludibaculum sp.]|jgi:hypothetical protein